MPLQASLPRSYAIVAHQRGRVGVDGRDAGADHRLVAVDAGAHRKVQPQELREEVARGARTSIVSAQSTAGYFPLSSALLFRRVLYRRSVKPPSR